MSEIVGDRIEVLNRVQLPADPTPNDLLRYALSSGADLDRLERLMEMQRVWEARQASKAFAAAMAAFKSVPIKIDEDRHVKFTTSKGTTEYTHASLANVVFVIVSEMAKHGLTHRWVVTQEGAIVVKCIVTHVDGHSEVTEMRAGADDSGSKNQIQAVASTMTYLKRHTLLTAVGLAAGIDEDDDGAASEQRKDEVITTLEEAAQKGLDALLAEWAKLTSQQRTRYSPEFARIKKMVQT